MSGRKPHEAHRLHTISRCAFVLAGKPCNVPVLKGCSYGGRYAGCIYTVALLHRHDVKYTRRKQPTLLQRGLAIWGDDLEIGQADD